MDVTVLTPVLNEAAHLREAAGRMLAQRFDGHVEFLFIDGDSTDGSVAILRELQRADPRIRILSNPRRNTPAALNIGLASARGEFIARMDAHTLYPEGYLQRGVERLRAGGAAHVSGPQIAQGQGAWSRRIALALRSRLGTGGADFRHSAGEEFEVDSGFTGVWPRGVLEEQGGWHEEWHNDQDSELAARIRAGGGRIVCVPDMGASYIPRDSLVSLARQYWRYGLYRAKTSGAHPESMRRSHVLAPGVALAVLCAALPLGPLRRLPLTGVTLWVVALAAAALAEGRRTEPETPRTADVAALPAIFGTMHLAWGFGFLAGCLRFGPPLSALAAIARRSAP